VGFCKLRLGKFTFGCNSCGQGLFFYEICIGSMDYFILACKRSNMKTIEQSVVESLDGAHNPEIFPYLPYILQDFWEMGADPQRVTTLVKDAFQAKELSVLDLGCGKGAVSVALARELPCRITGLDAVPAFILEARNFATQYLVHKKCNFMVADIRQFPILIAQYDVMILGAIGDVFGDLKTTLMHLKPGLAPGGAVVLDDAFLADESEADYSRALRRSDFYDQIEKAGFKITAEVLFSREVAGSQAEKYLQPIANRVEQLCEKVPEKAGIFKNYLSNQEYETRAIRDFLTCGTWLLQVDT
jgi:2-polyprenyl-3-methyl-5-hydroxy-6-metoxy-1,4-benzoquinol methylase